MNLDKLTPQEQKEYQELLAGAEQGLLREYECFKLLHLRCKANDIEYRFDMIEEILPWM